MNIIVIRCRRHNRGENPKSFHLLQIALDQGQKKSGALFDGKGW